MSVFSRKPKHKHCLVLKFAQQITDPQGAIVGVEWVRKCICGESTYGKEYKSFAAFTAQFGEVRP